MFPNVFSVVVFDLSEKVKSEKHSLIIRVRARDLCLADDTALNELHDASNLAELTLKIETVTLVCDKDYASLALVKCLHKSCNINIIQIKS